MLNNQLANRIKQFPLPSGWGKPELFTEKVSLTQEELHLCGLCAENQAGIKVMGSCAELNQASLDRSYFELFERAALVNYLDRLPSTIALLAEDGTKLADIASEYAFPRSNNESQWTYARSNGVALGKNFQDAASRALLELAERDRILYYWYTQMAPRQLNPDTINIDRFITERYEVVVCDFDCVHTDKITSLNRLPITVAGVFLFPRSENHPMIYGFGARGDLAKAVQHAYTECMQRFGFLWGEDFLQAEDVEFSATPDFHQESFLGMTGRRRLRRWIESGREYGQGDGNVDIVLDFPQLQSPASVFYVDLSPPECTTDFCVVKAISPYAIPLTFGRYNPAITNDLISTSQNGFLLHTHPIM